MPTELLRKLDLQCERFEFCPEVTAKLCRMGVEIVEVPISYTPRGSSDGKKIKLFRDGGEAVKTLWKWRRWRPVVEFANEQRLDGGSETMANPPHMKDRVKV
jgi:hypothetical protein